MKNPFGECTSRMAPVITQPMPADAASVRIAAREERAKVADEIFGAHALRSPP